MSSPVSPLLVGDNLDGDGCFHEGEGRLLLPTDVSVVVGVLQGVVVPLGIFAVERTSSTPASARSTARL